MQYRLRFDGRARRARAVWGPSWLRRAISHRLVQLGVAAAFAILVMGWLVSGRVAVESARTEWGETAAVLVVDRPISIGEAVVGRVSVRHLPRAMIPDAAVEQLPAEALAKAELFVGEVLLAGRVSGSVTAAAPGRATVTLRVVSQIPLLGHGDLVDVWMVDSANLSSVRVATRASVLAFSDDDVTISVSEDQVASLTAASLRPVTITLVG